MNNKNFKEMIQEKSPFTCFICTDQFSYSKKPLILVCGHTFCEPCLSKLYNQCKEIQCCYCKVITKLERFEDMITNYAILSISEMNLKVDNINPILCELSHKNHESVDKNLQCIDCNCIVCISCHDNHKNHKMKNLTDFIDNEAKYLSDYLKCYRELATKMTGLIRKIDKNELEEIVKQEKKNMKNVLEEIHKQVDKQFELINQCYDKVLKETFRALDNFKINIKSVNADAHRFCTIIEELSGYKKSDEKQKSKILNIYNINSTIEEINNFNKEINLKSNKLIIFEDFRTKFTNKVKNSNIYFRKFEKILNLNEKKLQKLLEKQINTTFFVKKQTIEVLNESSTKSKSSRSHKSNI
jgi:hypothetical protein